MTKTSIIALALAAAACNACGPPPAVQSAATVKAGDLPADAAELEKAAAAFFAKGEPVAMENALVAYDKLRAQKPDDFEALWKSARAAFWVADYADTEKGRKSQFARACVEHARAAVKKDPKRVEGHYYLAACLGYVAETQTSGALEMVKEVAAEGQAAAAIDDKFEHAGAHRLLGMVYLRAPGWPTSIGDADEALTELQKAVELDPDFPVNRVYLAEALLKNDKAAEAGQQLEKALSLAKPAEPEWARLEPRWRAEAAELQKKVANK